MRVHPSWCAAAFLCTAALAGAQMPAGPPILVNEYTTGDPGDPRADGRVPEPDLRTHAVRELVPQDPTVRLLEKEER